MQEWLDSLDAKLLTAGFAGALVALAVRPTKSICSAVFTVFSGMACAVYVTPWINYWAKLPENLYAGLGFLTGLCAMPAAGWLLRNVTKFLDKKFKDT